MFLLQDTYEYKLTSDLSNCIRYSLNYEYDCVILLLIALFAACPCKAVLTGISIYISVVIF